MYRRRCGSEWNVRREVVRDRDSCVGSNQSDTVLLKELDIVIIVKTEQVTKINLAWGKRLFVVSVNVWIMYGIKQHNQNV